MTTVITRYFDSAAQARDAKSELVHRRRFSLRILDLFDKAEGLAEALVAANVAEDTARAYEARMASGGAVLLVRAGHKPLGVAQTTRDVTAQMGAADMGGLIEEVYVQDERKPLLSVLADQPLMLTRPRDPDSTNYHMADWPIPLISRRKPSSHFAFPPHARMASFPFPLSYKEAMGEEYKPFTRSIFGRHARMANWPIGLLAPSGVRYGRFPFGLLVPGNKFMANWPIGHIVPGHKHYADVPIGLKVPHNRRYGRFPFGLLVPGQKYMANFPFGHIVPGHKHYARWPFGLLVPGHKYMANWIWPHTRKAG